MADNLFFRNASGQLSFAMGQAPADSYRPMCKSIAAAFGLVPHTDLVTDGLAIVFQDYRRSGQVVGLEWDNWMGFTVVAKTEESEPLVRNIGDWLLGSAWASAS